MKIYDIMQIMEYLPHRYPFILIDRVVELEVGKRAVALKNVSINEPFFQGHFPGEPIFPGVLIIEALGQTGGVLVMESRGKERHGSPVYFMGFDRVRFRKPVLPGDQLLLEVSILKMREKVVKLAGVATVEGQRVAEAELMAAFGEKK
ncbi:MAG: 3-hydroxyacyl-ACP dehydratase FabZ [Desulfococcaceae bacterium]|jgi:beta-hydroxyacyl-ACP dehydratase FabZ|nr:3-hydroxyacyl-ACP dehydratase FabZ [Desulfococcaceae bacterium]